MPRALVAGVLALWVIAAAAPLARAQGAGKSKAVELLGSGDKKLAKGDKLLGRGDIEKALAEFESALADYQGAYEAYPDPQIYFPIAQAEQRLGRFVDALQHYQQLLEEGKDAPAKLKSQVQHELTEVKKNLAAVVVEATPEGALIFVDDAQVAKTPMSQPVFVEPGAHTLAIKLEGFKTVEDKVDLAPGKEFRKRVDLEKGTVASTGGGGGGGGGGAVVGGGGSQVDQGPARPSKTLLWVGIGVTGALVLAGTVTGFMALSKHKSFHDDGLDADTRENARRDGKQLAGLTDVLLGGALVGGLVTTYYYYGVYRPGMRAADAAEGGGAGGSDDDDEEEEETEEASLQVTPVVSGDFAGVAASGRF